MTAHQIPPARSEPPVRRDVVLALLLGLAGLTGAILAGASGNFATQQVATRPAQTVTLTVHAPLA